MAAFHPLVAMHAFHGGCEAALAKLLELQANGGFLKLPEKEREALLQSLGANLPPEYSAMIQKYYRDLADKQKTSKAPLPSSR